jgi:serine/threonine-protein kinase
MADLIGRTLLNQFRVEAYIASGGMGAVFRVWDLKRSTPLAMKVLHAELADDPAMLKRFQREANALRKLAHPHIVPFYGLHQAEEVSFLLEAFIDGPSLKDLLRNKPGRPLPVPEALSFLKALSSALGYAHANKVVHCDVKPGNVMVDPGGQIFLTDFGIARHAESTTTTLATAGTSAYMAPEQVRGEPVTPGTDIYALGVILFELLTGQRPFRGTEAGTESAGQTSNERIRYAHLHLAPPDPRTLNPAIPPRLASVVMKAMVKPAEGRYQSAQEFYEAACAAVGTAPERIPERLHPSGPGDSIPRPQEAHKTEPPGFSQKVKGVLFMSVTGVLLAALLFAASRGESQITPPTTPSPMIQTAANDPLPTVEAATPSEAPASLEPATPTFDVAASPTRPQDTPVPTFTPHIAQAPTIPNCPGAIRSQIQVDMLAQVCTQRDRLITRGEPLADDEEVFRLNPGTEVKVTGGPACVDGSNWWQIRVFAGTSVHYGTDYVLQEDTMVWVREGSDVEDPYYICPP